MSPVRCSLQLKALDRERFHAIDKAVMRQAFDIHNTMGRFCDEPSLRLRERLAALLSDWGTHLELPLYREALLHFCGGPRIGMQPVDILSGGSIVGQQNMALLDPVTAWKISAIGDHQEAYQTHLLRLLAHTPLERMHWVNLNRHTITLSTLFKKNDPASK